MGEYPRVILGAGKQAGHVLSLLEWMDLPWKGCLLFDDRYPTTKQGVRSLPLQGTLDDGIRLCRDEKLPAIVALGSKFAAVRYAIYHRAVRAEVNLVSLIHPSCQLAPTATISRNIVMMPGCVIGPGTSIGDLCCLFSNVTVEHDCRLGENVTIGPGATLSGFAKVGAHSFLGAGTVCAPEVTIHERCLIGAGSVVVSDAPPNSVCFGVPARVRRLIEAGDDVPLESQLQELSNRDLVPDGG